MKFFKHKHGYLLDLGCGTCILKKFIPDDTRYVGLDFSKNMLRKSHNLEIIQADAEYLPFKENSFDSIFIITVIQNLSEVQSIFKEILKISRPTCIFYASVLKKDDLSLKFEENLVRFNFKLKEKIELNKIEDNLFIFVRN